MNRDIRKLYDIANKESRIIVGLMSGTSLDGLDIALCRISGSGRSTIVDVIKHTTISYNDNYRENVREIFARKDGPLEKTCQLHAWIAQEHARMLNGCLQNWNIPAAQIDLIASHGQTVYHAPQRTHDLPGFGNSTLQIGDADHLAYKTGIICISDFRQKHIAAGGEGAPLAAYGDFLLFAEKDTDVVLLNIGGIANFSFIPSGYSFHKMICSDTGPGNTMMDAFIKSKTGQPYDDNACIASTGKVHDGLLHELMKQDYFTWPFPKTTGPEMFNTGTLQDAISQMSDTSVSVEDIMATLNRFTAESIIQSVKKLPLQIKRKLYVSGGGIHNPVLMYHLKTGLQDFDWATTEEKKIHPDAKEAVLFALLANECVAGNATGYGEPGVNLPAICMGKISLPH